MRIKVLLLSLLLFLSFIPISIPQTYIDTDGDGLSDYFERTTPYKVLGWEAYTSPNNPDTDGDGLSDGLEVKLGTNPVLEDSDWDNIKDGIELLLGTNPTSVDTDNDGMTDDLELFEYHTNPTNPDTDGDGLRDDFEVWELSGFFENPALNPDVDDDGILDGQEIYPCLSPKTCVKEYSRDPTIALCFFEKDCDGDGLDDKTELSLGTGITDPDTDDDGLIDGLEIKVGANPFLQDTDGDGVNDFEEANGLLKIKPLGPYYTILEKATIFGVGKDVHLRYCWEETLYNTTALFTYGLPSDPTVVDTDGDGLTDWEERNYYVMIDFGIGDSRIEIVKFALDPSNPDTDGDGIIDSEDPVPVTLDWRDTDGGDGPQNSSILGWWYEPFIEGDPCPYAVDCDKDGIPDGVEVIVFGTDPLNPDTDGDGLKDVEETGQDFSRGATWSFSDPLKPDTDGDGFTDYAEKVEGTDPTNPESKPSTVPISVPTYEKVEPVLVPKFNIKPPEVEIKVNGKKAKGNIELALSEGTVSIEINVGPLKIDTPNGTLVYEPAEIYISNSSYLFTFEGDTAKLTVQLKYLKKVGVDYVCLHYSVDYNLPPDAPISQQGLFEMGIGMGDFCIKTIYKTEPKVKLVNATWLNELDVGRLVFECRFCKNVTIIVPGALVNGQKKRTLNFGNMGPLKYFYARVIPLRYQLISESDVGTVYSKYENSVEVLKTGKDIGLLTAKAVEAKSLGSKIIYGMVATAKGIKTIIGGIEAFIPEDEMEKDQLKGNEDLTSAKFDRESFKKGVLDTIKEKLIDATFDYVTEKAVEYADAKELEARRYKTTYKVVVKACNDFYCKTYSFTFEGYSYETD